MGKFAPYKLPLKGMAPGEHLFEWHLGHQFFADMENTEIHDADLAVKLTVVLKDDIYKLHFDVNGTITLLCDRCLDTMLYPVDTTYDLAVEYGDAYNDESDTLLVIPASDASLNVAYMIYDTVVLTIPMKHVHPTGQCNKAMSAILNRHSTDSIDEDGYDGAADDSGEAPTDPRWDALKGLADS